jgi:hypothetical protein
VATATTALRRPVVDRRPATGNRRKVSALSRLGATFAAEDRWVSVSRLGSLCFVSMVSCDLFA